MRIACLAWGSLIWKPGPLALDARWSSDGPPLPIEFARESDGGELATAITPGVPDVRVYWAPLATTDVDIAREQLRRREQIPVDRSDGVGVTIVDATDVSASAQASAGGQPAELTDRIADWARGKRLDAVVWTALPPRSNGVEGRMPTVDEACDYLRALPDRERAHAENYVRCVPTDLRTPYRAAFEARLGWTPLAAAA